MTLMTFQITAFLLFQSFNVNVVTFYILNNLIILAFTSKSQEKDSI